jgi:elongator complex protein 2
MRRYVHFRIQTFIHNQSKFVEKIVLKGHTDWVRSMDFMRYSPVGNKYHLRSDIADGDLLLASASQDKFIRIWKITGSIKVNTRNDDDEDPLLAKLRTDQDELNTKVHTFSAVCHSQSSPAAAAAAVERQYAVYLESVLAGHDDWVYTVQWHPPQTALDQNGNQCIAYQPTILLSASADNTMIVWYPDEETGVWTHEAQLGDPHKNILGIYGAMWGSDGKRIVGYGRNGAFHLWQIDDTRFSSADLCFIQCGGRKWTVIPSGLTGHFRPVTDMTWDVSYRYLISVSLDQTTRIWCKFHHQSFGGKDKWRELSRAQVHGYDLRCVTSMDKWRFASGADGEKIARVFIANRPFAQAVSELCPLGSLDMEDSDIQTLAMGATIPSLSLSNRAMIGGVQGGDTDEGKPTHKSSNERFLEEQGKMHASLVTERQQILSEALKEPTEEYLAQYTLWGEQEKLYGHGYELYSMAALPPSHCDPEGVLATACTCRAANSKDASIRLWSSKSMKPIQQPLESHTLTVTRLKFSHNGQFLASVGRDRVWSLWRRSASGGQWALGARLAEAHSRIIWDTAWTFDDKYFLTASRDKSVKMWRVSPADDDEVDGVTVELAASWKFDDGVTAIDSLAIPLDDDQKSAYLIAVGFENGAIQIHCITAASDDTGSILQFSINQVAALDQSAAHSGSVKRVCFRAVVNEHCKISREKYAQRICYDSTVADNSIQVELATCGDDQTVRIYKLT